MIFKPEFKLEEKQKELMSLALPSIVIKNLSISFSGVSVLHIPHCSFQAKSINCIIGPSGGGKSTLLRSMNRINDEIHGYRCDGEITIDGQNALQTQSVELLRKEVGMVFQKACVFPLSIKQNVLFGITQWRKMSRKEKDALAEKVLKQVALWDEVMYRLDEPASTLSIGQQQRLSIARTLAMEPKILLLDESTSAIDPQSTFAIEALMRELAEKITVIFVTHDIAQAWRIADTVTFVTNGTVVESGVVHQMFDSPRQPLTKQFLNTALCGC